MTKAILLSAVVFATANPLLSKQSEQVSISVYDENCSRRYSLIVNEHSSELIENSSKNVIERFENDSNPYLKSKNMDYLVYVESNDFGHKHIGISNNNLIDIDTNKNIVINKESIGNNIYDCLTEISFNDIPSNAYFCKYSYYFKNLKSDEYGKNENNTCAVISAQMMFGYYDSVYNDDVVEEKYDNPMSEDKNSCIEFTKSPSTKGDDFFKYLINYVDTKYNIDIEKKGIKTETQIKFMNDYISEVRNLKYAYNSSEGNAGDILTGRQFIIVQNAIKEGRPAILNNLGHSMLAFAYDDTYVYLMSGWRNDKEISKMKWDDYNGNLFTNYCSAYDLVLEGKEAHKCSNNYYSTSLGKYICPKGDLL